MDLINEFGFILSKQQQSEFDTLIPAKSKLAQLYNLIISGKVQNDEQAAKIIYNSDKSDKKYLMLKRNLVNKLSDLIFLQNYYESNEENYKTIKFQVEKELVIAEKLLSRNVYHNPNKIIKKVEQTAQKYYLIDTQVAACRLFRTVYSLKGFPTETIKYDSKLRELTKYQQFVSEAYGMWEKLYALTKYSRANTNELYLQALSYTHTIKNWINEYTNPFLLLNLYRIELIGFNQSNNYKSFFDSNTKLEKLAIEFPFINSKSLQLEINYNYATYYRNTNQLKESKKHINKCLNLSDYRAFDKFLIQELNWDINLKSSEFDKAAIILNEVFTVPQYQLLDPLDKSAWAIREAYLYYIFYIQQNQTFSLPNFGKSLDIEAFLKRTKKSSKDKVGYNINLLIIRLLLFKISNNKEIDKEGNNLKIYFHRYLKELNSKRTLLFFKQLSKIASSGFFLNELDENSKILILKTQKTFDTLEWIPYDLLWEYIISDLS